MCAVTGVPIFEAQTGESLPGIQSELVEVTPEGLASGVAGTEFFPNPSSQFGQWFPLSDWKPYKLYPADGEFPADDSDGDLQLDLTGSTTDDPPYTSGGSAVGDSATIQVQSS